MPNCLCRSVKVAWIGYSDKTTEGTWKWEDPNKDGVAKNYNNWQAGQPDDQGGNEDCGSMSDAGVWNDFSCENKNAFFCEFSK